MEEELANKPEREVQEDPELEKFREEQREAALVEMQADPLYNMNVRISEKCGSIDDADS